MEHFTPVPLSRTGFRCAARYQEWGRIAAWVRLSFLGEGPWNVASSRDGISRPAEPWLARKVDYRAAYLS